MSTHPTAPGPSSADLKTRVAAFMRRSEAILAHRLAEHESTFKVTFETDGPGRLVVNTLDFENVNVEGLVYVASLMRPIVYTSDDPIHFEKLTSRIEHEHAGFRGKIKPFRLAFLRWMKEPIIWSGDIGDASSMSGRPGQAAVILPIEGVQGDVYFADLFFNAEVWHCDIAKAAEYAAADVEQRQFIAKCAEVRTLQAIPFIRSLHSWVTEVREMGMDI